MKKTLTDRFIRNVKPAKPGQRDTYWDALLPSFGLRVTSNGVKSFIVYQVWANGSPGRRTVGNAAVMPLAEAREIARQWIIMAKRGQDPKKQLKDGDLTFAAVAEAYIAAHVNKLRRREANTREIRRYLVKRWGHKPISEVSTADVIALSNDMRATPATGRLVLGHCKTLFTWVVHQAQYQLDRSPAEVVKPKLIFGKKKHRQRVLSDAELKALWKATHTVGYPVGACVRMLLLTACRRGEIAGARWSEVDGNVLTVPAERFKSEIPHRVPLSFETQALLENVPRFERGDFIFSFTGARPINGWSRAKDAIDDAMGIANLPDWKLHDLRHTVRTRLAAMGVTDVVAEMVLGHGSKGIQRTYDHHSYFPEIADALERWAVELRTICDDKIVKLGKRA